jgi:hypothetical protein
MNDPYKIRRAKLLWKAYKSVPEGDPVILDGNLARDAKYDEAYGEQDYYRVFWFDVTELEKDGAITPATEHRSYENFPPNTLYWITDSVGTEMLRVGRGHVDPYHDPPYPRSSTPRCQSVRTGALGCIMAN